MRTETITQSVTFGASPHEIYEALMDSKKHSQITGEEAAISREIGGKFRAFNGYATGTNLELVPDRKIVQLWRASDWPKGHYSTATFSFEEVPQGTRLDFTQTGVPELQLEDIAQGWQDYYWTPMKEMLDDNL